MGTAFDRMRGRQGKTRKKGFVGWIKDQVTTLVDPDRESRVNQLTQHIRERLYQEKRDFSLKRAVAGLEYKPDDLEFAVESIYRKVLAKAWDDQEMTRAEQAMAEWVAGALELDPKKVVNIDRQAAQEVFGRSLAQAMEDGVLDDQEEAHLQGIAAAVGLTMPQFTRLFFQSESEGFLRGVFATLIEDEGLSKSGWNNLLQVALKLGVKQDELYQAIRPQAERCVEHVLADAKSDGRISVQEVNVLNWMLNTLGLSSRFSEYVRYEMDCCRALGEIEDGKLPVVKAPRGIATRSGELVHFVCPAVSVMIRQLKNGPRTDRHAGTLVFTDSRFIHAADTKSQIINYSSIVSHDGSANRIYIQVRSKPAMEFILQDDSPFPYPIFESAVAMSNQTKVAKIEGQPTRHIPRDVRQRIWQRYGGRCADCNATEYLEFDHIVPFSKGGSNSDANIQLLCRGCNLKKSDKI